MTAKREVDQEQVRQQVKQVMTEDELTGAEVARQSGVSMSRLSPWLAEKYTGDGAKVAREVGRWLALYHLRKEDSSGMPPDPEWAATPTAGQILAALGYAQLAGDIALIYGGAGCSKTATGLHYAETRPNVWFCTANPTTETPMPILAEIAAAVGIQPGSSAAATMRDLVKAMRGKGGMLILDEAQNLGVKALDAVRAIHDATEVGLALLGNEEVYTRMTGGSGSRAAYLDRLFSRVGKRLKVSLPQAADVEAYAGAWKAFDADSLALLRSIASKPGALRMVRKTIRLAAISSPGGLHGVGAAEIRATWGELWGGA